MYKDIIVDLETHDTETSAVILSIGAVAFNPEDNDAWEDFGESRTFYSVLEIDSQLEKGATQSKDTLDWWQRQGEHAKKAFEGPKVDARTALDTFAHFCMGASSLWGNGNMFDNAILREAFKRHDLQYPFKFWEDLDMRTIMHIAGGKSRTIPFRGIKHHALDDAKHEVLLIQDALWRVKGCPD